MPGLTKKFTLMAEDRQKWVRNQLAFLKPMVAYVMFLYLSPIVVALQEPGHVTTVGDFIPSPVVITAIVFYIVNALYDLSRKLMK